MKIMKDMKVKKLRLQAIGFGGFRDSGTTLCASVFICGETVFLTTKATKGFICS